MTNTMYDQNIYEFSSSISFYSVINEIFDDMLSKFVDWLTS
jgi:hypothetical protein